MSKKENEILEVMLDGCIVNIIIPCLIFSFLFIMGWRAFLTIKHVVVDLLFFVKTDNFKPTTILEFLELSQCSFDHIEWKGVARILNGLCYLSKIPVWIASPIIFIIIGLLLRGIWRAFRVEQN